MDVKHSLHFQQSHRPAKTQPVRWLFATHDLECEKAGVISKRGVPSLAPGFYGAGSIPAGTQLWNQSLVFMPLCSRQQRGSSTLFSRRAFDSKKQRECAINPETAASRNHPGAAGFLFSPQHRGSTAGRLTSRRRPGTLEPPEQQKRGDPMYDMDKESFGKFLAALRKEKGLTQRQLSQKLFVSDKAVSKWERGGSLR